MHLVVFLVRVPAQLSTSWVQPLLLRRTQLGSMSSRGPHAMPTAPYWLAGGTGSRSSLRVWNSAAPCSRIRLISTCVPRLSPRVETCLRGSRNQTCCAASSSSFGATRLLPFRRGRFANLSRLHCEASFARGRAGVGSRTQFTRSRPMRCAARHTRCTSWAADAASRLAPGQVVSNLGAVFRTVAGTARRSEVGRAESPGATRAPRSEAEQIQLDVPRVDTRPRRRRLALAPAQVVLPRGRFGGAAAGVSRGAGRRCVPAAVP